MKTVVDRSIRRNGGILFSGASPFMGQAKQVKRFLPHSFQRNINAGNAKASLNWLY
ncbi:hypothetical protein ACEQPO_10825 [Bacillus sp. SL00103]